MHGTGTVVGRYTEVLRCCSNGQVAKASSQLIEHPTPIRPFYPPPPKHPSLTIGAHRMVKGSLTPSPCSQYCENWSYTNLHVWSPAVCVTWKKFSLNMYNKKKYNSTFEAMGLNLFLKKPFFSVPNLQVCITFQFQETHNVDFVVNFQTWKFAKLPHQISEDWEGGLWLHHRSRIC